MSAHQKEGKGGRGEKLGAPFGGGDAEGLGILYQGCTIPGKSVNKRKTCRIKEEEDVWSNTNDSKEAKGLLASSKKKKGGGNVRTKIGPLEQEAKVSWVRRPC